jgi:TPR repeat protein
MPEVMVLLGSSDIDLEGLGARLKPLAAHGNPFAKWALASVMLLWPAIGRTQEALLLLEEAVTGGAEGAKAQLARQTVEGRHVTRDISRATELFSAAAKAGVLDAAISLAEAYDTGSWLPRDRMEATRWFKYAAERGDPDAALVLANRYRRGVGCESDMGQCRTWLRVAAEAGNREAELALLSLSLRAD